MLLKHTSAAYEEPGRVLTIETLFIMETLETAKG